MPLIFVHHSKNSLSQEQFICEWDRQVQQVQQKETSSLLDLWPLDSCGVGGLGIGSRIKQIVLMIFSAMSSVLSRGSDRKSLKLTIDNLAQLQMQLVKSKLSASPSQLEPTSAPSSATVSHGSHGSLSNEDQLCSQAIEMIVPTTGDMSATAFSNPLKSNRALRSLGYPRSAFTVQDVRYGGGKKPVTSLQLEAHTAPFLRCPYSMQSEFLPVPRSLKSTSSNQQARTVVAQANKPKLHVQLIPYSALDGD